MVSAQLKRSLGRITLALAGIVLPLMLAELVFRLLPAPLHADLTFNAPSNSLRGMYETDAELLHRPTPGFNGSVKSLGYDVEIRINSYGLRGPEPGAKRGERWLAAGDSFTFAAQVNEAESFVGRLSTPERELHNAGADGYATWQALVRYQRLDEKLDLDGVLLVFFLGNDLHDNSHYHQALRRPQRTQVGPEERPSWLRRNSVLWARWRMRTRAEALKDPNNPERQRWANELQLFMEDDGGLRKALLKTTEKALRALRDETSERGDRLLVAVAPPAFQVQSERIAPTFELVGLDPTATSVDAPAQEVHALLERLDIPACDLVEPLRAQARTAYFEYDGHWTPDGHAVVADTIRGCF